MISWAAKKCMSTAITVEFTSATDLVMRQKTRVDDETLKILGIGWLKRKALKASLALMPESQKAKPAKEWQNNQSVTF